MCCGPILETQIKDGNDKEQIKENGMCLPNEKINSQLVDSKFDALNGNPDNKCQTLINGVKKLMITQESIKNEEPCGEDSCHLNGDFGNDSWQKNDKQEISNQRHETDSKNVSVDDTLGSCVSFLSRLRAENERLKHPVRGPLLAPLELYRRLTERKIDPVPLVGKH